MAENPRDWAKLNAAIRHRGERMAIWLSGDSGACAAPAYILHAGAPCQFSDALIEALLTVRVMLHLSLRALDGFAIVMARLDKVSWNVSNYTTLCPREALLDAVAVKHAQVAHAVAANLDKGIRFDSPAPLKSVNFDCAFLFSTTFG